jgi:alpha-L-fucosidase
MKSLICSLLSFLLAFGQAYSQGSVKPLPPLPSSSQVEWNDMEFYLFAHFGPNTFTDLEWGKGTEEEDLFAPTALDCRQWCRVAKAAGVKGIILTAKHHDGFCLWPSKYSEHTVAKSKWRDGKGDVLMELSKACREYGLKMGIYLSPWDRNHPQYGTPEYNEVFVNMMKEVVSRYGPFFEFWWDGANGEGPGGKKMVYNWKKFKLTLKTIAPNTMVFSDIGPHIRWVGNESGIAGKTNWALLDTAGFQPGAGAPPPDTLNRGNENGHAWIPAECDVSIRPGWFYHKEEDSKVKSAAELFRLYLRSVGRNANLLLNVPPDRRGLFTSFDSAALMGFKELRDKSFSHSFAGEQGTRITTTTLPAATRNLIDKDAQTYLSLGGNYRGNAIGIQFREARIVNCVVLQEPTLMGQRVKAFTVEIIDQNGGSTYKLEATTIGHKRILTFPGQMASGIRITITDARAAPLLGEVGIYKIDDALVEKE